MSALARARSWLFDIFAHHHAERLRTERAVVRKVQGVDGVQDLPYPGSQQNPTVVSTTNNTGGGWVKGALLGAAMLVAGGAGVVGLTRLSSPAAPVVTTPAPAKSDVPVTPGKSPQEYDAVTEELQPDGSWKEIKREHLKP